MVNINKLLVFPGVAPKQIKAEKLEIMTVFVIMLIIFTVLIYVLWKENEQDEEKIKLFVKSFKYAILASFVLVFVVNWSFGNPDFLKDSKDENYKQILVAINTESPEFKNIVEKPEELIQKEEHYKSYVENKNYNYYRFFDETYFIEKSDGLYFYINSDAEYVDKIAKNTEDLIGYLESNIVLHYKEIEPY